MNEQAARVVAVFGIALAAIGVLIGFIPISVEGSSCGAVFYQSRDARVDDLVSAMSGWGSMDRSERCDDKRSMLRVVVIPLILGGGAAGCFGVISVADARKREQGLTP